MGDRAGSIPVIRMQDLKVKFDFQVFLFTLLHILSNNKVFICKSQYSFNMFMQNKKATDFSVAFLVSHRGLEPRTT